jgi:hypothetical protein
MSISDGTTGSLPEELDRALRRATDRTLAALTSLRRAVREHVQSERDGGASLAEIENDIRIIIARAQESLSRDDVDGHHEALTAQMIKWTGGFFEDEA